MNKRIKELMSVAFDTVSGDDKQWCIKYSEKFAELIVAKVLDEVSERAYYSGDRAWSDEVDRKWIELEFGYGELAEIKE